MRRRGADPGGDGEEGAVGGVSDGKQRVGIDDGGVVEADADAIGWAKAVSIASRRAVRREVSPAWREMLVRYAGRGRG